MAAIKFPGSENNFIESHTLVLAANRPKPLQAYGRTFVCVSGDSEFQMAFNNGKYFDCRRGVEWQLSEDERFNLLMFKSTQAQTIKILTGNFFFHENIVIPIIQVAKTRGIPGATSIAGGANLDLETTPAGLTYRKSVVVTNKDAAVDLDVKVKDASGVYQIAGTVFHLQAWYLETSDAIRITNPGGAPVSVGILELFYIAQ